MKREGGSLSPKSMPCEETLGLGVPTMLGKTMSAYNGFLGQEETTPISLYCI